MPSSIMIRPHRWGSSVYCWPSSSYSHPSDSALTGDFSKARTFSVTVRKHVCSLADKGLISTEDTTVFTRTGLKHNGSLLYTIRPFHEVLDAHQQNELRRLEVQTAGWEYTKIASP